MARSELCDGVLEQKQGPALSQLVTKASSAWFECVTRPQITVLTLVETERCDKQRVVGVGRE